MADALDERFAGGTLDPEVWFPYYLPHWSSRSQSSATWSVRDDGLHLSIPNDQPLWCPDLHDGRMSGIEDRRERSGEICVAEMFGDAVGEGFADIGMGLHPFRDPGLVEEFATERLALDVAEFHTYGVDWQPGCVVLTVDGVVVRRLSQSPDYPMQLMIGVFDFPAKATDANADVPVPELIVARVHGTLSL